jgi:hypothetical protein
MVPEEERMEGGDMRKRSNIVSFTLELIGICIKSQTVMTPKVGREWKRI